MRVVVLAMVALAGCTPAPPADTVAGRCREQADNDPAVKAVLVQASSTGMGLPWQAELARTRHKSFYDCMVAAGAAPPGGVQAVDSVRYPSGWY